MKTTLSSLALFLGVLCFGQNILLVNDNDYITQNTDSIKIALNSSIYSSYDVWSIPDSGGTAPSDAFMLNYDLVIWYCSTDGSGLMLWDGTATATGNSDLIAYIIEEKPLWIIGSDMLYEIDATPPDTYVAGDFAYDYMGIESYDVQSYGDDGSTGLPQVNLISGAPATFPDSLLWSFATLWWVDGVTPRVDVDPIYEMGPSSYPLSGEVCMVYNDVDLNHVMTTFFDPALINNQANRVEFLEEVITFLLPADLGIEADQNTISLYPNPANSNISISSNEAIVEISIYNVSGALLYSNTSVNASKITVNIEDFQSGIYMVQTKSQSGSIELNKFVK